MGHFSEKNKIKNRKLMAKIASNPWEQGGRTHLNNFDPQTVFMLTK